jgi:hypothetical protein
MAKLKSKINSKYKAAPKRKLVLGGLEDSPYLGKTLYESQTAPNAMFEAQSNVLQTQFEKDKAAREQQLQRNLLDRQMLEMQMANSDAEQRKQEEAKAAKEKQEAEKQKALSTVGTGAAKIGKDLVKSAMTPTPVSAAGYTSPVWTSTTPALTAQSAGYAAPTLVDPAMQATTSTVGELLPNAVPVGQNAATMTTTGTNAATVANTAGTMSGIAAAGTSLGLVAAGEGVGYWATASQKKKDDAAKRSQYYRDTHYTNKEALGQIGKSTLKGAGYGVSLGHAVPGIGEAVGAAIGTQAGLMVGTGIAAKNLYDTKGVKVFGKQYGAKNKYDENLDPTVLEKRNSAAQLQAMTNTANAMENARMTSMTQSDLNTGFALKNSTFEAKYGGNIKYLKGGVAKSIGRGAVEYVGKKHEHGGIDLPGNIEVEGGETEQNDYVFSATLKLPNGATYAQAHKNLIKSGATGEEIHQLALSQEAAAGRNPNQIKGMKFAKYGGPLRYDDGGVVKFDDGGPFDKYQGNNAQFSSQKDIDKFNEEISKILTNSGQYSAADVQYARELQKFLQKNQSEFSRAFTKGNNVWIPMLSEDEVDAKWEFNSDTMNWTIDSPTNSVGDANYATQPSYSKSARKPRPSMYVSQASNRTDEGIANTVTNQYFNTRKFPKADPTIPAIEPGVVENTQNTSTTTEPTTTYNPPVTTNPPAAATTNTTTTNPPAATTNTNATNTPVPQTVTTNNPPVTTQTNNPPVTNTNTTMPTTTYTTAGKAITTPTTDGKPRFFMGASRIVDENGNVQILTDRPLMGTGAMSGSRLGTPGAEGLESVRSNSYDAAGNLKIGAEYKDKKTGENLSSSDAVADREVIAGTEWGKRWGYKPGMSEKEAKAAHDAFAAEMRTKFDQSPEEMLGYYQYLIDSGKVDSKTGKREFTGADSFGDDARAIYENLQSKGYIDADGKIKQEALPYLKTQATNEFVGPIHNAAGAYSLKGRPIPVKIPGDTPKDEETPPPTPVKKDYTIDIPPPPTYTRTKSTNGLGLIQAIPAAAALTNNIKTQDINPSLTSSYVQPGAIGRVNLGRTTYNFDRAANLANYSAMNQALQNMSGPGAVAGMLAAKTKADQQALQIGQAEQNTNMGRAGEEAKINAGISQFNVGQAMAAQQARANIDQANAGRIQQANQFNRQLGYARDVENREQRLAALDRGAQAITMNALANRQIDATENLAMVQDYTNAYKRYLETIAPTLGNTTKTTEEEPKTTAKFGGVKKYVSRLGDLKNNRTFKA